MIKNSDFFQGVQAGMPIAIGYFPIAIAFGALALQADLNWMEAVLMSLAVYAGASQFVGVSMIMAGAGAWKEATLMPVTKSKIARIQ